MHKSEISDTDPKYFGYGRDFRHRSEIFRIWSKSHSQIRDISCTGLKSHSQIRDISCTDPKSQTQIRNISCTDPKSQTQIRNISCTDPKFRFCHSNFSRKSSFTVSSCAAHPLTTIELRSVCPTAHNYLELCEHSDPPPPDDGTKISIFMKVDIL